MIDFFNTEMIEQADTSSADASPAHDAVDKQIENDVNDKQDDSNKEESDSDELDKDKNTEGENNVDDNVADSDKDVSASDAAKPKEVNEADLEDKVLKTLLKKYNLSSKEELERRLNPETDEQKNLRLESLKAGVNKYAIEKGYLKNADIVKLENLKNTPKQELVYNDFSSQYKERFKDRKDELGEPLPVTDDEIKNEFNKTYHISSENPIQKSIGEQMIEDQSKKIVGELEDKYKEVEEEYKEVSFKKAKSKEYIPFVKNFVKTNMPQEISYGEGENKVAYRFDSEKFSEKDVEDLERFFMNTEDFENFIKDGERQKLLDSFKEKMDRFLKFTHHERIVETIAKVRYEAGLKAGSSTGAKAPFKQTDSEMKPVEFKDNELTESEMNSIAESGAFSGRR